MPDDMGRGFFGAMRDEDSLLSHVELVAGAVSSILRDSDLKKVGALSIEEALALTLREPLLYVQAPSLVHFLIVSYC